METVVLVVVLGLMAGTVSTVAGMGGGLLMLLALSIWRDPGWALAVTTPALLCGNVHRTWLFRREVSWRSMGAFSLGAVPGGIAGGFLVAHLPAVLVQVAMVGVTLLAAARAAGKLHWRPSARVLTPAGAGIGVLTGATGGAGLLAAPLFLSIGLSGATYVGTVSASAVAMHCARIIGYGAGGLITGHVLLIAGITAPAIFAGNGIGGRLRGKLGDTRWLELGTLATCVALSVFGVAR